MLNPRGEEKSRGETILVAQDGVRNKKTTLSLHKHGQNTTAKTNIYLRAYFFLI